MQHSSAGLRPAGRRVAAVVAAGAVALSLFAGAWASTHELTTQANPKRLVDNARAGAVAKLNEPKIKYPLIGVGLLIALLLLRKLFR